MLNLVKNFQFYRNSVLDGQWSKSNSFCYQDNQAPIYDLNEKNLVIVGRGEIGLSLAKKAEAFGMHVFFSERPFQETCRDGYIPFNEALQIADILSLNCALNADNQHMLNQKTLSQMKANSFIVNVSRGGLVNEQDILDAIRTGHIAGYAADVMAQEPPHINNLLVSRNLHNILITPHIAWASKEAKQRMCKLLLQNIHLNLQGIDTNRVI
ncbi:hypothetical protein D7V21_15930 [Acinetobacter guerrae]|uniref:D-isomer specific 2-hydroxyacid dehydrogenase NAD-binding domain-containing protein n=1 Tax=Acinetobacter guerrae TaxID=1843371 RepID=A0A3A8E6N6_9GAMM|nr:hypothetical protein D7V21_15930 [Acinetobacter guerrae]